MADTGTPSTSIAVETISGQITAAPHNTNYGEIATDFNAHTHDIVAGAVTDTELDAHRVRSIHASNNYALVSGVKNGTFGALDTYVAVTITFATDASQGDPVFTVAPVVTVALEDVSDGVTIATARVTIAPPSTTAVVATVHASAAPGGGTFNVYWMAYGRTA